MELRIAVLGGDGRMPAAADYLEARGCTVLRWGLCDGARPDPFPLGLEDCGALLLPLPVADPKGRLFAPGLERAPMVECLLGCAEESCRVFGGGPLPAGLERAGYVDLAALDTVALLCAVPTAEGALSLAIQRTPRAIWESCVLITGFGRVGQATARLFVAAGARVTVAARSASQRALADETGCLSAPLESLAELVPEADIVVNTVPAQLFTERLLRRFEPDALLLDLASRPGGVDFPAAHRLGVNVEWALGLPGRFSPVTAGEALGKALLESLGE